MSCPQKWQNDFEKPWKTKSIDFKIDECLIIRQLLDWTPGVAYTSVSYDYINGWSVDDVICGGEREI